MWQIERFCRLHLRFLPGNILWRWGAGHQSFLMKVRNCLKSVQQGKRSLLESSGWGAGDGPLWAVGHQSFLSLSLLFSPFCPRSAEPGEILSELIRMQLLVDSILLNVYVSTSLASFKSQSESCVFRFPKWNCVSRGGLANWLKNKESI